MPPRKRQQTYRRRRRPAAPVANPGADGAVEAAARQLVESHPVEELPGLVAQAEQACELADREALEQPSPAALRRYRMATTAMAEAQRALALATRPRVD